jgi:hypothetical protein
MRTLAGSEFLGQAELAGTHTEAGHTRAAAAQHHMQRFQGDRVVGKGHRWNCRKGLVCWGGLGVVLGGCRETSFTRTSFTTGASRGPSSPTKCKQVSLKLEAS